MNGPMKLKKVDKTSPIPRYYQAQSKIESLIRNNYYKPGNKLMPERKLASLLGVSRVTVRRAIGELVVNKVLGREWGSGTFVSKKLKPSTKVKNLGITIWAGETGIGHFTTAEVVRGIEECIKDKNCNLRFLSSTEETVKKHLIKLIEEANIDGVLIRLQELNRDEIESIRERNIPLVLLEPYELPDCFTVNFDYLRAFYIATEYLIKLGHKKIALINGSRESSIGRQALKGYQEALKKYGLNFHEEMVRYGCYSEDSGYKFMKEFLEIFTPPMAILTGDDTIAAGAMKAIREKKLRIAQDISIIGCNDMPIASYLEPSLTTVKVPFYEIGRLGAEMLVKILNGKELNKTSIVLEPKLVIRNSTGAKS